MSITPAVREETAPRRVRHLARDAVTVMAFSAACSVGFVLLLFLLLGRSGR